MHKHVCINTYIYTHIYIYIHIYIYVYIHIYVCMYIFIHTYNIHIDNDGSDDEKDKKPDNIIDTNNSTNDKGKNTPKKKAENIVEYGLLPPLPNYYNWKEIFPQLHILFENIEILKYESKLINSWVPWPEDHYAKKDKKTGIHLCM
jgi:hypothetical protein